MQVLNTLLQDFTAELSKVQKVADLLNLKSKYIGKQGPLSDVMKNLKDATPEERKTIGAKANEVKGAIEELVSKKLLELEVLEINENLAKDKIDISLTDSVLEKGLQAAGYHPVTIIQKEIEDIFISMGFEVLDGPHIEDDYHNFEALNIPDTHPARDMQDTFWFADKKHLLRTHTSTIQVRGMKTRKPPFRFVGPGKVFRCERTDASHEMVFHQLEGMMVGEDVSVGNLIYFMKTLLTSGASQLATSRKSFEVVSVTPLSRPPMRPARTSGRSVSEMIVSPEIRSRSVSSRVLNFKSSPARLIMTLPPWIFSRSKIWFGIPSSTMT